MNKTLITVLTILSVLLSLSISLADDVNMEINVNGTANLNVTIETEDTELREDVYGTESSSSPEDTMLIFIDEHQDDPNPGWEEVEDICHESTFNEYFKSLVSIPPEEFIQHLKALGYDDETHITLIWTICQEKYIEENEGKWSSDRDFDYGSLSNTIRDAIEWLFGKETNPTETEVEIAESLDSYFASDADTSYLLKRINDLTLRVEALENALNDIASESYCRGKLKVMLDYGLEGVKCDDTTYFNHQLSPTGEEMIIGIIPVNGEEEVEKTEIPEEIPIEEEDEIEEDTEELPVLETKEINLEKNKVQNALMWINSKTDSYTRGLLLLIFSSTVTILIFQKTYPTLRKYVLREIAPGVQVLISFMTDKTGNTINGIISILRSSNREEKFTYRYEGGWSK